MAGIDGTVLVASIAGLCTLTATVTGVIVKGRYDNRRHARDLAARSDERWQDLRLARCAALLDALTRARAELAEIAGTADEDGYDPEGRAVWEMVPSARPEYLVSATNDVALIASHDVVMMSALAVRIGWDDLATAYRWRLESHTVYSPTAPPKDQYVPWTLDKDTLVRARIDLTIAIDAAEHMEDRLREAMRHHLTDIDR